MSIDFDGAAERLWEQFSEGAPSNSDRITTSAVDVYKLLLERSTLMAANKMQADRISGLSEDLRSAVRVAFKNGAKEWVRLNYSDLYGDLLEGR